MKKIFVWVVVIGILLCGLIAAIAWHKMSQITQLQLNNTQSVDLTVASGSSLYGVKNQLQDYVNIDDIGFKLWVKLNPQYSKIQAGLYELPARARLVDVISLINSGKVKQFSITLLEGQTITQWLSLIKSTNTLQQDLTSLANLYGKIVQEQSFCRNEYLSLEGCLLPDTYFYTYQEPASSILKRAYTAMDKVLDEAWKNRFLDVPIHSKYETLILASIIEKDTAIDSERAEIAGVFANRLNKNMRLQTDPTVIYGIGESYDGNITRKHLRQETPYNTYVIKGLPITPIAMSSQLSILAATQPALTDAYYFVASGDGGHTFSVTLAEHNKAVQVYLKQLRKENEK